ncbi:MAG: YIP1 family protein [Lachnospiraceae bacterium]
MKKWTRKCAGVLLLLLVITMVFPVTASAAVPYKTYTIDGYGYVTETQTAYMPESSIVKLGDYSMVTPKDLKVTEDGHMYIADAGAGVVYETDLEGNLVTVYGEGKLKEPYGVFVTDDKSVYVADHSGLVVVFDKDGNVTAEYAKPNHPLYGSGDFKPIKIVVNKGGDMYIVCEGNGNGLVQLTPTEGGTFLGYFGTNYASVSLLRMVQEAVFTDAQLAKMVSNLPATPVNVAIDDQGLIYTVTPGEKESSLKKLNIAGSNLIEPDAYDGKETAVAVGNHDNVYVASSDGYIYEYNSEGDMLFVFGGRDDGRFRIGLSKKVEAIDVDANDNLYILDSDSCQVQVFRATEFTNLLHSALNLYENGRYAESKEPLEQVLEMNSLFDYANEAMSRSYLQEEDYENALKYARVSKAFSVYSDAFWEVRNTWLRNNMIPAVGIIVLIILVIQLLKYCHRKKGIFNPVIKATEGIRSSGVWTRFMYMFYYMKHPVDGAYGLRYEGKSAFLNANIMLGLTTLIYLLNKYCCGFLLRTVREGRYTIGTDALTLIGVFLVLVICNYLMCTINDGESTFKRLYCGLAFCLAPYVILQPFCILLSNVITYNEVFLIQFAEIFIFAWVAILVFMTIKETNNYTVKETFKIIFFTLFTVLILALLAFILFMLCRQVIEFIASIFGEVVYRIGK